MSETRQPPQPSRNPVVESPRGPQAAHPKVETGGRPGEHAPRTPSWKEKILWELGFETNTSRLTALDQQLAGLKDQRAAIEMYASGGWGTGLSAHNDARDAGKMQSLDGQMAEIERQIAELEAKQQGKKRK